ncbi:SDR family NAD(P)-dependent oxidoreductase [Thalassotalea agarivorans]|uniref:Short-chain dehydrogenase n=1 Tax=Thalassotalea agarivorans TaxID=349064 RepID=A0A1H9Y5W6_THASX|nr:SDR family NAD(P)-dependent oxidoreductase [Thalassotalea agarivorans]SES63806.1 Short-chain dehydrogenase [Thalassotalea agarivorans]
MSAQSILITGATSGIGEALAYFYADQGWLVHAIGRNQDKLTEMQEQSSSISGYACDLSHASAIESLKAEYKDASFDVIVLNAGTCRYMDVSQFDSQYFTSQMRENLASMVYCIEALQHTLRTGSVLALMSSSARYLPFPKAQAYGASKAAIAYLAESLALEWHVKDIHVATISPGFVKTPLTDKNEFDMPFMISAEDAANRIYQGINKRKHDIAFPKRLIWTLHMLNALPKSLYFNMMKSKL